MKRSKCVDRVVDRVVLAVVALAAEADVERGDAEVLQERAVVGARTERVDLEAAACRAARCAAPACRSGSRSASTRSPTVPPLAGSGTSLRDLVDEPLEAVRAADVEQAACVHVGVDVGHGLGAERLRRGPRPTRSSRAAPAPRRPRPRRRWSASASSRPSPASPIARASSITATMPLTGSDGAVHPCVVMVAADDPLVGQLAALQRRDDVVGRARASSRTAAAGGRGPGRDRCDR